MGALFLTENKVLKYPGLNMEAHSTVGTGDGMEAALAFGMNNRLSLEEGAKLSLAASAGAVTT